MRGDVVGLEGAIALGRIEAGFRLTKNLGFEVQSKKPRYNRVGNGVPGGGTACVSFGGLVGGRAKSRMAGKSSGDG